MYQKTFKNINFFHYNFKENHLSFYLQNFGCNFILHFSLQSSIASAFVAKQNNIDNEKFPFLKRKQRVLSHALLSLSLASHSQFLAHVSHSLTLSFALSVSLSLSLFLFFLYRKLSIHSVYMVP